jgi:hypothetical protein
MSIKMRQLSYIAFVSAAAAYAAESNTQGRSAPSMAPPSLRSPGILVVGGKYDQSGQASLIDNRNFRNMTHV